MIEISETDVARIATALADVKAARTKADNAGAALRHRVTELEKIIQSIQVRKKS